MLGATVMMAALAFFQPFKHPDILSINTGAQIARDNVCVVGSEVVTCNTSSTPTTAFPIYP